MEGTSASVVTEETVDNTQREQVEFATRGTEESTERENSGTLTGIRSQEVTRRLVVEEKGPADPAARQRRWSARLQRALTCVDVWILIATLALVVLACLGLVWS
jgi:hypothetical protein